MNIIRSALGYYEATADTSSADLIIGESFGTRIDEFSVNRSLANSILLSAADRPVVADRMLVDAYPTRNPRVDLIVEGSVSNLTANVGGSWGVLLAAKKFMEEEGLHKALMIGQANHVGRVMMQADELHIDSIAPENLPNQINSGLAIYFCGYRVKS